MDLTAYNKTNQIDIEYLILQKKGTSEKIDIFPLLDQMIIYEDLFQTAISAKLIFTDQVNLVGSFPIVGGEWVTIKFKTPIYGDYNELEFRVYEVGERGLDNSAENLQTNVLKLCTNEVWWASNNDISAGYQGTYTSIISTLLFETGSEKKFDKENSIGVVEYVAPAWNTFQCIKFCASRANSFSQTPMFFWETPKGYHFKSLNTLYKNTSYKRIYIEDKSMMSQQRTDAERAFNGVYSFEYLSSNNRLEQFTKGSFGAEHYSVDLNNAGIFKKTDNYQDLFHKRDIHLNKYPLNDNARVIRNKMGYIPVRSDMSHINQFNRAASVSLMDNIRVMVNIPGDSGLKTGDIVDMDIPAKVGLHIVNEEISSGGWLVRSIKHLINKNTYSMVAELVKDSFDRDITGDD